MIPTHTHTHTYKWITPLREKHEPSLEVFGLWNADQSCLYNGGISQLCSVSASWRHLLCISLGLLQIAFSYKFTLTFFQKTKHVSGSSLANEQFPGPAKAVCIAVNGNDLCAELVELWFLKTKPIVCISGSVTKKETKQKGQVDLKWKFQAFFYWGGWAEWCNVMYLDQKWMGIKARFLCHSWNSRVRTAQYSPYRNRSLLE